jgi:hypothetical protein
MVLPDIFIDQSSPEDMYSIAALNASDIEAKVLNKDNRTTDTPLSLIGDQINRKTR